MKLAMSSKRTCVRYCCVRGCNTKAPGKGIFLHTMPKDKDEREIWMDLCGIPKANRQQLPRKLFVCQLHFKLSYPGQIKLYQGTRPTLNLPDPSILTEETSDTRQSNSDEKNPFENFVSAEYVMVKWQNVKTYSIFDNKQTEETPLLSYPSEEINVSQADSKENQELVASDNVDCSSTLITKSTDPTPTTETSSEENENKRISKLGTHKDKNESENCSYCKTSNENTSYYLEEIRKLRKEFYAICAGNVHLESEIRTTKRKIYFLKREIEGICKEKTLSQ